MPFPFVTDAFAVALAKRHKAEFVTVYPDFGQVKKEVRISWLKSADFG